MERFNFRFRRIGDSAYQNLEIPAKNAAEALAIFEEEEPLETVADFDVTRRYEIPSLKLAA